ncbi:hypothetical protein Dde_1226 [Oleidesulfovibrio alaskensis G20]|uniref:HTH Mu-type domain-containing protein n=1 Tax=Oleidesulfovibrio alaskensis (strain ATCC BAA-1058 / DSM 17464 / G20) TaxID=207559 RepID=Q312W9_OLEA2|nr:hypothetical protein Dde_1226 [Oleidesulfovibrio alaskensis G20]
MVKAKDAYTAKELAPVLSITERAVLIRAEREGWQYRWRIWR